MLREFAVKRLAIVGAGASCALLSCVLLAAETAPKLEAPRKKVQATQTQKVDFPSGGAVRLTNSIGTLTVIGWDQPQVETTTIKTTKQSYSDAEQAKGSSELDKVRVTTERKGDEVVVATEFPRHRDWPPGNPWGRGVDFDLEYQIHVPRNAKLVIERHDVGEIHVDDLTGDIAVNLLQGEVMLHLPEDGKYTIDAKADFGHINCDFPGEQKPRRWLTGHRWVNEASGDGAHKLNQRVGYGDVVILKTRIPKQPPSLLTPPAPTGSAKGL